MLFKAHLYHMVYSNFRLALRRLCVKRFRNNIICRAVSWRRVLTSSCFRLMSIFRRNLVVVAYKNVTGLRVVIIVNI